MAFILTDTSFRLFSRENNNQSIADRIGSKKKTQPNDNIQSHDWKDVNQNIKEMDQIYDATFCHWLKSEENVLVTSIYLHRIANEYPLERIVNALTWLANDWRWESISVLVRHVTVDWTDDKGDEKRAILLRQLTQNWATHFTATLITTILVSTPYLTQGAEKRERLLKEFTKDWGFSKLSEFFMFLRSKANIDCKFKCAMLQEAAKRDAATHHTESAPKDHLSRLQPHHRRTSSNDFKEIKLSMLEEIDTKRDTVDSSSSSQNDERKMTELGSSAEDASLQLFSNRYYTNASSTPSDSNATTLYSHHHHHHSHLQNNCMENNRASTTATTSSSNNDRIVASSASSESSDKKRLTSSSKQV